MVLPRTDGIFIQPTPYGAVTDGGYQARLERLARYIGNAPSRKGKMVFLGQITGHSLDLHNNFRGEKPGGDPGEAVPQVLAGGQSRNAYATC